MNGMNVTMTMIKKDGKEVFQEDVNNIIADMIDVALKTVDLTDTQQDELWDAIAPGMEKFFGYPDFRSYN